MLNRKNLTLSALSNRLNLGTRSLVFSTGVSNNGTALRIRHTHHDVMRDSADRKSVPSIPVEACAIPSAVGSATASAAAFIKAAGGSWNPDAAPAWFVPSPSPSSTPTWQGWQSSQSGSAQRTGANPRPSSRSRRRADGRRAVEVEYPDATRTSPLAAVRPIRAAVAE